MDAYSEGFFQKRLSRSDPAIFAAIGQEEDRQRTQIELIAPKNYLSGSSREALASIMAFTSVEGYPGKRYHAGVANIDIIEQHAINRAKQMFQAGHANVQPHSGTQSNQAVYFALLSPGDTVLSMDLSSGGHLSHGLQANLSGRWFNTVTYGTDEDGFIDYEAMEEAAQTHRPKLIIVGGSSYPRAIDFERVAKISRNVGAHSLADVAHFAGLIVGKEYPQPFPHIDVVTTTTNKNLRGPRGGLIVTRDKTLGKRIDAAVFPGIQGGPLPEMMTAKAVCFGEALTDEFRCYARNVLANARAIAQCFQDHGFDVVTGGTDTPLVMLDLRKIGLTGEKAQAALERHGITTNRNLVPNDRERPNVTSGLRLGTSAISARGIPPAVAQEIAIVMVKVLNRLKSTPSLVDTADSHLAEKVKSVAASYPIYE
ncbi:serine hydroxymethyltransferase [Mesorhizobium carmichaelinearum]|uniref:serine hydroxymethyltransferase n=1 Tax=Mesorhizobium carmichaelinearum TaxID=1208188 RepID=UPI000BA4763C|nr:serine hydroxymethyltransferase [Mesorhizobium carmichaelinearum]